MDVYLRFLEHFAPTAESFWAMRQFFAVLFSLLLIFWQIRLHRISNMLSMISAMDSRWNSKELLDCRKKICERYSLGNLAINQSESDVLGFFEDLGIFLEKRVFDESVVWDKYSYYVEHYWPMYEKHVQEYRTQEEDPTWFEKFEYLAVRLAARSRRRKLGTQKTSKEIDKFISGELNL